MSERVKTILLILFIVGVIGAFNSIIRLSKSDNQSPFQTIAQALGLAKKEVPTASRSLDYVPSELNRGFTPPTQNATAQTQPTPTPQPQAKSPTPQPIQTSPELPPLPPISNTLGVSTKATPRKLPPLPPIKTLGAKTQSPSLETDLQNFLKSTSNFFGF